MRVTMAKAKKARAKQGHLDGMAPPSIPEIDKAADNFVEARNAWQRLKDTMEEKKAILEALMKKNELKAYEYDGKVVSFDENIHVRSKKKEKAE